MLISLLVNFRIVCCVVVKKGFLLPKPRPNGTGQWIGKGKGRLIGEFIGEELRSESVYLFILLFNLL